MKHLERLFFYLFPTAWLKGTAWESDWNVQERSEFLVVARVFFFIVCLGYIAHYFTVDVAEGLAPSRLWFTYRFSMASIALVCLIIYLPPSSVEYSTYFRAPAILAGGIFCFMQSMTILWYPEVPYLYTFAFVIICTVILRTTILKSIAVASCYLVACMPVLIEAGVSSAMASSGAFFSLAVIVFARAKYETDLKFFLMTQRHMEQQKKLIEINLDFTDRIRAFLPAEISNRLTERINERRLSVLQSIDEVLRPRKQRIACLFSDIRGFTKGSRDLEGFVANAVYPNVRASSMAVERFHGIPRKVGDLIFAYFDRGTATEDAHMALNAAVELSRIGRTMNQSLPEAQRIRRYILLSYGEAIVGNLSGFDSSIEITAIGDPVNFLSRLDEATKSASLSHILRGGDIILSSTIYDHLSDSLPRDNVTHLDLRKLGTKIRDYEDTDSIFLFRPDTNGDISSNWMESKVNSA